MYGKIGRAVYFDADGSYFPSVILALDNATGRASLAFWATEDGEQVMQVVHDVPLHKPPAAAYPCAFGGGGPANAIYMPDSDPLHRKIASLLGFGAAPGTLKISIPDGAGGMLIFDAPELPEFTGAWMLDPTWGSPPAIVSTVATLLSS